MWVQGTEKFAITLSSLFSCLPELHWLLIDASTFSFLRNGLQYMTLLTVSSQSTVIIMVYPFFLKIVLIACLINSSCHVNGQLDMMLFKWDCYSKSQFLLRSRLFCSMLRAVLCCFHVLLVFFYIWKHFISV